MELPNYRMPGAKNVCQLLWEKAKDFLQRAFTVIFVATIVIWFLQTFDGHLNVVTDSKDSLLAMAAGVIAPVFKPLGFRDWRVSTALDYRIHGKGKCGFDTFYIIWFHRKSACGNFSACCCFPSGIQPFVYTMCGCCFFH